MSEPAQRRTLWLHILAVAVVKTGLASGALIEVFGDLRAGDEVTARGTDELQPGTEVHIKETKPGT